MSKSGHNYSRRVLATAGIYIAAAWAVVEALLTVVDRFGLPSWSGPLITALFVSGLPVTVYLVWRTAGPERKASPGPVIGSILFLVAATAGLFWATRPPPVPAASVVAVLPCDFEGDNNFAYRAEGVPEDVYLRLSRVSAVKLSSWNSSLFVRDKGYPPRQIAELLHVDRLVQCQMKSGPDRIELTATVLDPADDTVLWNNRYDFATADLGTVVTELAGTLLDVLNTPAEASESARLNDLGTFSPEAYDLYLQARVVSSVTRLAEAVDEQTALAEELATRALEIDPNYAQALVLKSELYLRRAVAQEFEDTAQLKAWVMEARQLAERALELDSGVFGARFRLATACGLLHGYYNDPCPPEETERLIREECEIRGKTAEGWACWTRLLGDDDDKQMEAMQHWLELEPTNVAANLWQVSFLWEGRGKKREALSALDTLRVLAPDDWRPLGLVSNMLREEGRFDEVLAWRFGAWGDAIPKNPWLLARLGTDYLDLGLYPQALDIGVRTWETRRASSVHFLPQLWIQAGKPDRAEEIAEWLSATLEEASGLLESRLQLASFHAMSLRDYDRAKTEYEDLLKDRRLEDICLDSAPSCVVRNALVLAHIAKVKGDEVQVDAWLNTAQQNIEANPEEISGNFSKEADGILMLILQDRREEAIGALREAVFDWTITGEGLLAFPLLFLQQDAMFDPLREMPGFQQLLLDYEAYLKPLQQNVLAAERAGDWEALRRQTYHRING